MTSTDSLAKPGQFKAMISSTALDLPEHRAAVEKACIAAEILPIGMEHLPARDASGIAVSLEMVDKADLYLGIYAWRYGWVPDGKDISITEMEFDRAVERQAAGQLRELLIFTAHKNHPVTIEDIETGDIPQKKLAAFKTKATTGRDRKEFKSVEELRRLVSEALADFKARLPADTGIKSAAVVLSPTIPHYLPRLDHFHGRGKELAQIRDALRPEKRTWGALIAGPGGMGKTSLAVRAASEYTREQFDPVIFVSITDRALEDEGPRTVTVRFVSHYLGILDEIARALARDDIPRSTPEDRARLILDALAGTRALLILDNLESLTPEDRERIVEFVSDLPGVCKAILTARRRIGRGINLIELDQLDEAAALATLADITDSLSAPATKTTALCGRKPPASRSSSAGLPGSLAAAPAAPSPTPSPSSAPARRKTTRSNSSSATSPKNSPATKPRPSAPSPTSPFRWKWSTSPPPPASRSRLPPPPCAPSRTAPSSAITRRARTTPSSPSSPTSCARAAPKS